MLTVGLDVHFRKSSLCVLDAHGRKVREREVRGPWSDLMAELAQLPEPFQICYEASLGYGHLYDQIRRLQQAHKTVVAHPGHLRLIFKSKKKNDRIDAAKLATLLYLDQVPEVHVPSQDVRSWRALIEWRQKILARRVMVKNQIRSLVKSCGVVAPGGAKLWTRTGLAWLRAVPLPTACESLRREMLLDELAEHEGRIRRVEAQLARMAAGHPSVGILRSIPGVGIRTAEAVAAYVDDPGRFSRGRALGSYLGLVPSQDASAEKNRLGHITREGPATVRKLLVEAAWQGIRRSRRIRERFERIGGGDPGRKKIALVATARWLAVVMAAMLKNGELWRAE